MQAQLIWACHGWHVHLGSLCLPSTADARRMAVQGCFDAAIARYAYSGAYRGAFPVKCNHDRDLVAAVVAAGAKSGWGLEVGSKPELLLAMSALAGRPGALLICNGYKDAAYVELVPYLPKPSLACACCDPLDFSACAGAGSPCVRQTFSMLQCVLARCRVLRPTLRDAVQVVHCWQLGLEAVIVLEQFQVLLSRMPAAAWRLHAPAHAA